MSVFRNKKKRILGLSTVGGVRQVRDPHPGEVSRHHPAPRADALPSEWRRAQRLHHALPHGLAGAQPLSLQSGG